MGANQSAPVCPPAPACPAPVACPPVSTTLGFNYKSVNPFTDILLQKTQKVITQFQKVGCKEMVPKIIYQIKNETRGSPKSADEMKRNFAESISNMGTNTKGVSKDSMVLLKNSIIDLFNTFVDNATVNGMTDQLKANQAMIDALSSFCPGEMMGTYTVDLDLTKDQKDKVDKIRFAYGITLSNDEKKILKDTFKNPPSVPDNPKISDIDNFTTYIFNNSNALPEADLKTKVQKMANDMRAVLNLPTLSSATTKSTFGSMSNFGSMGASWIMILLLLIIVAVLYFYSQGKLKFPTMGQRVAQFGRDMRSIRGIRARR